MKFFLYFCLIYSVTLYGQRPEMRKEVKKSVKLIQKALEKKS